MPRTLDFHTGTRAEIIKYLKARYPATPWERMKKARVMAVYIRLRSKES